MERTGEQDHGRLWDAVEARRLDLDLLWKELAARASVSTTTLENIRAGRVPRARTRRKIEDALGWAHGSVNRLLAGKDPILVDESTLPKRREAPDPLTATTEQIIEFLDDVREVEGEDAYRELLAETLEVQRQALRDSRAADQQRTRRVIDG